MLREPFLSHRGLRSRMFFMLLAFASGCALCTHASGEEVRLNETVLEVAQGIPDGGGYFKETSEHESGVPVDVVVNQQEIYRISDKGSYCSGFTIAVAIIAMDRAGCLPEGLVTTRRKARLQFVWYNPKEGNDEARERGCVYAIPAFELGHEVEHEDAMPGDFMQYWRVPEDHSNGHSAIFLEWITRGPQIVGFRIRSSQECQTDGVGDRVVIFRDVDPAIVAEYENCDRCYRYRTYFARLQFEVE